MTLVLLILQNQINQIIKFNCRMTKNITVFFMFLMMIGAGLTQVSAQQESESSWEDVQVVYDLNEVTELTKGSKMTETIKTSLNFGTKSKVKRDCLKQLKKQAADKGYSVIYIDQEASKDKRFNKRGIEVTMVGVGFKS